MFHGVHRHLERLERPAGVDVDRTGGEGGAVVDAVVGDEVHHHAGGPPFAGERGIPGPPDRVGARQVARERRMQVDHLVGEPAEEAHREDAHPTGEHHQVGLEPGDDVGEPGVVFGPGLARCCTDVDRRHTRGVGALEREHVGPVRDHGHDPAGDAAVGAGIEDRLQVRTVPGDQHHDAGRSGLLAGGGDGRDHGPNLATPCVDEVEGERKISADERHGSPRRARR